MSSIDYSSKIPNNVNLGEDRTLQRALEPWLPNYLDWWQDMGPSGSQNFDVYLRTATSTTPDGWAHFGHVKMPDYRWGIFLADRQQDRKIGFGDFMGQDAWQDVPGEFRSTCRRLVVEERRSFSPDALTGMEANLRFAGQETPETKVFGRLTAWQNWIFQRPNAVGPKGALKVYGSGEKAGFDLNRV